MIHTFFLSILAVGLVIFLCLVHKEKTIYLNRQEAIAYLAKHCPNDEVFFKCEYQLDFISEVVDLEDGNYSIEERWKVIWLDNLIKRHS
jgi:hypothetical protein